MRMIWNSDVLHTVREDDEIHLYRPYAQQTLCGLDKTNEPRTNDEYFTCDECRSIIIMYYIDEVNERHECAIREEKQVA